MISFIRIFFIFDIQVYSQSNGKHAAENFISDSSLSTTSYHEEIRIMDFTSMDYISFISQSKKQYYWLSSPGQLILYYSEWVSLLKS